MLYTKMQLNDQVELKVDLYEDEVYSSCKICRKEVHVKPEELAEIITSGNDFCGTSYICSDCVKEGEAS